MITCPAVVVMAHADPVHLRRLIGALDPWPVLLHVDVATPADVHGAMLVDLPERVTLLPRIRTGWARWENVEAELSGYRAALSDLTTTHVVVMTGSDYALVATSVAERFLEAHAGRSFCENWSVPAPDWGGRSGGIARLRYPHWAWRKHMVRVPLPRRLPQGLTFEAGSQMKVLTRAHAQAVLDFHDGRPDVVRFWRRTWCADESFVPTALASSVPDWSEQHVHDVLWHIDWNHEAGAPKSPRWLRTSDLPKIRLRRDGDGTQLARLFARKFSSDVDHAVLDALDEDKAVAS